MIKISISNFRGVPRADLNLSKITMIAGPNAAGKTSIAWALQALLTGVAMPAGLQKKHSSDLICSGGGAAVIDIEAPGGKRRITYPSCEVMANGEPPRASPEAAGSTMVSMLSPRERAAIFSERLKIAPTADDLKQACESEGIGAIAPKVWGVIEEQGWDGCHAKAKDNGARFKGQWEQITNERYGSAKAANWIPGGWESDLRQQSVESLDEALSGARATLEGAIANAAVSAADYDAMKESAAMLPALRKSVEDHQAVMDKATSIAAALQQAHEALPAGVNDSGLPCPHCSEPVRIVRSAGASKLEKATKVDEKTLRAQRDAKAAAFGAMRDAERSVDVARATLEGAIGAAKNAERDELRIRNMARPSENDSAVQGAREAVRLAEERISIFRKKSDADRVHKSIAQNEKLLKILAPEGLRKRKLDEALTGFNGILAGICKAAKWPDIVVTPELAFLWGGRPSPLCSQSEQFRVDVALQLALAKIENADMVVIDAADVLDSAQRNGLVRAVQHTKLQATIMLAESRAERVPNFEKIGGASYWVQGGIVSPLSDVVKEAA